MNTEKESTFFVSNAPSYGFLIFFNSVSKAKMKESASEMRAAIERDLMKVMAR
jgi:hypothetical protein